MASNLYPPLPGWASEPSHLAGQPNRKALPIKKEDAQPLTRKDIQYDLLNYIFSDDRRVFTSPTRGSFKVNFRDLYIDSLHNSSKCSKVLKDKMLETPEFAIELAKISLLTNVGRINTTMAFFPEMKTALRTYHPVPSLQKTDGNLQDAPRIKNCLKAAVLPSEFKSIPPSTPQEILQKVQSGEIPPTSVVNLIFVLSNHATPLASVHFETPLNFCDLFLPRNLSSYDRARAFLWLVFYYHEGPQKDNPFHDDYSRNNRDKAPVIRSLSDAEMQNENVDTREEIEWGRSMSNQRNAFLRRLMTSTQDSRRDRNASWASQAQEPESRRTRQPNFRQIPQQQLAQQQHQHRHRLEHQHPFHHGEPDRRSSVSTSQTEGHSTLPHYARSLPYTGAPARIPRLSERNDAQERTILEQAWHSVTTTDPLCSDEEDDEHSRLDYTRRLGVIRRLCGDDGNGDDAI